MAFAAIPSNFSLSAKAISPLTVVVATAVLALPAKAVVIQPEVEVISAWAWLCADGAKVTGLSVKSAQRWVCAAGVKVAGFPVICDHA